MTISTSTPVTKVASLEELRALIQWAADEGWNPGLDDVALFHGTDPSGFFVTYLGDRPVAGISVVKHSDEQAFLGLYLCVPEFRGTGFGLATWNHALTSVANRTVGLDGVVEQQDNYRQSDFAYHFGNTRYSGPLLPSLIKATASESQLSTHTIRPAKSDDLDALVQYDALVGGFERRAFLNAWLAPSDSRYTYLAVEDEVIVGMLGIRKCIEGFKIGPLFADSSAIARQLLLPAAAVADGDNVMLDVSDKNSAAVEMATSLKLQPIFETARMYKGAAPAMDLQKLFGVATLELG